MFSTPEARASQDVLGYAAAVEGAYTTVAAVVEALYRGMSFQPGALPDYDGLQTLFLPGAVLVPPSDEEDPVPAMDFPTFAETSRTAFEGSENLRARGFVEAEVARRVEQFNAVAHVTSTYEIRYPDEPEVSLGRGLNSIQLVRRAGRWWITSLSWDDESPTSPLPDRYLPGP